MIKKISVDQNKCASCAFCEGVAPEVFNLDPNDMKAKVKTPEGLKIEAEIEISEENLAKAQEAQSGCPSNTININ
ncbi:MAG: ferredoxin [Parcubacteria group bacterium]|nr:ferredoxin [Parcubacteria group bacterium]